MAAMYIKRVIWKNKKGNLKKGRERERKGSGR